MRAMQSSSQRTSRHHCCTRRGGASTARRSCSWPQRCGSPEGVWTEALRGVVDAIVLTPAATEKELGIELKGNLAAMLGSTVQWKGRRNPTTFFPRVALVAGAGFEPATFGL